MAHALKSTPLFVRSIYWPRVLDLAMLLTTNFAIWALLVELPNVLHQL